MPPPSSPSSGPSAAPSKAPEKNEILTDTQKKKLDRIQKYLCIVSYDASTEENPLYDLISPAEKPSKPDELKTLKETIDKKIDDIKAKFDIWLGHQHDSLKLYAKMLAAQGRTELLAKLGSVSGPKESLTPDQVKFHLRFREGIDKIFTARSEVVKTILGHQAVTTIPSKGFIKTKEQKGVAEEVEQAISKLDDIRKNAEQRRTEGKGYGPSPRDVHELDKIIATFDNAMDHGFAPIDSSKKPDEIKLLKEQQQQTKRQLRSWRASADTLANMDVQSVNLVRKHSPTLQSSLLAKPLRGVAGLALTTMGVMVAIPFLRMWIKDKQFSKMHAAFTAGYLGLAGGALGLWPKGKESELEHRKTIQQVVETLFQKDRHPEFHELITSKSVSKKELLHSAKNLHDILKDDKEKQKELSDMLASSDFEEAVKTFIADPTTHKDLHTVLGRMNTAEKRAYLERLHTTFKVHDRAYYAAFVAVVGTEMT